MGHQQGEENYIMESIESEQRSKQKQLQKQIEKATEDGSNTVEIPAKTKKSILNSLRENDPSLIRLDMTEQLVASSIEEITNMPSMHGSLDYSVWRQEEFFRAVSKNTTVQTIHLSGNDLDNIVLTEDMMDYALEAIGRIQGLKEIFVFRGNSQLLTIGRLARCLSLAADVKVVMVWGFGDFGNSNSNSKLAGVIRHHPALERLTITLPAATQSWASMDVYAMACASQDHLEVLSIRCDRGSVSNPRIQQEPIFSPEAISILLSSTSVKSLYLENCGLADDHTDAICEELPANTCLEYLDIKDNLFSDDAMYTFAALFKKNQNQTLRSLDLSGVYISEGGGQALAVAMETNTTLHHLELEDWRYQDEFDIPPGNSETAWFRALDFSLRLNRAGRGESALNERTKFIESICRVSDNVTMIYSFLRDNPQHCESNNKQQKSSTTLGVGNNHKDDDIDNIYDMMPQYVRDYMAAANI